MTSEIIKVQSKDVFKQYIQQYRQSLLEGYGVEQEHLSLHNIDFSGLDLMGLTRDILVHFNFAGAIMNNVQLDRVFFDYLLPYMREKKIVYSKIILKNQYLGSKIVNYSHIGVRCNILVNFFNVDIRGWDFSFSDIEEAIFDNNDIESTKFIKCRNIQPEQFIKSKNYKLAIFSESIEEDQEFKRKIEKLSSELVPDKLEPRTNLSQSLFSTMFDPVDEIRIDDPYYVAMRKANEKTKVDLHK